MFPSKLTRVLRQSKQFEKKEGKRDGQTWSEWGPNINQKRHSIEPTTVISGFCPPNLSLPFAFSSLQTRI